MVTVTNTFRVAAMLACISPATGVRAQSLQVGPIVQVAQEQEPKRFVEPHLAVHPGNPSHLLAAAFIVPAAGELPQIQEGQRCASFVTRDAGATWARHEFPLVNCIDPQVAILADGQAVFLALGALPAIAPRTNSWLIAYHSADGGVTWDREPTVVGRGHDHPALIVDLQSPARKGWLYVTTHHVFRDGNGQLATGIFVARSRNAGRTFDTPVVISPNNMHNFGEMPAVLADGTFFAAFVDDVDAGPGLERRRAWVLRSQDGATTFLPPMFVNDVCGPPPGFQLSALAADTSSGVFRDRLYFACRQHGGGTIAVAASGDRGATWNRPGVPAIARPADLAARRVVTMNVSATGVLGLFMVERSSAAGEPCLRQSVTASFDGGRSFVAPHTISQSACGTTASDAISERMHSTFGDYYGMVPLPDGSFRIVWPEIRGGRSVLLMATIEVQGTPRVPQ